MKRTELGLIALAAAIATIPLAVSAQSTLLHPLRKLRPRNRAHHHHKSSYGLIGLLGLLGLVGLRREKNDVRPRARSDDRPPAPPGSYVSDLKAARGTKPEQLAASRRIAPKQSPGFNDEGITSDHSFPAGGRCG